MSDDRRLAREGMDALRAGDGALAAERLEAFRARFPNKPAPTLALAQAYRLTGDAAREEGALAEHLKAEPRHLGALLLMGQAKAARQDRRAAASFFNLALAVAARGDAPAALTPLLEEARRYGAESSAQFEASLLDALGEHGLPPGSRVAEAVDLLLGKRELYLQQPSSFYFPGLPQRQFFERDEFPWLAEIEPAIPEMRRELDAILADADGFAPYVATTADRPPPANELRDDDRWGAYYLWKDGAPVADHAARAPLTMAALDRAPMPLVAGRSPNALYSRLKPGTHIKPHHGLLNTRLIVHIPLVNAPDCALRVGNETRSWQDGEALIFDDSIEHEAWNRGGRDRIVLLFEIWRPELTTPERAALTTIFAAIPGFGQDAAG